MNVFVRKITPKRQIGLDPKTFEAAVRAELKDVGKQAEKEMAKPTRQWKAAPGFKSDVSGSTSRIEMIVHPVGPNAAKYERIDQGTEPHVIRPNPPRRFLRFMPRYLASTIPQRLWSRLARRSGAFVYARVVHHPGIKARDFSGQVYRIMNPEFRRRMRNLIRRELNKNAV